MKHIRFDNLSDLLAFLCYCAGGEALGKRGRAGYDQVCLVGQNYALPYALPERGTPPGPTTWDESGLRFGGTVHDAAPGGLTVSVNSLLLALLLRPITVSREVTLPTLALAVPADGATDLGVSQTMLHAAWRALPPPDGSTTQYFFRLGDDRQAACHAAVIRDFNAPFDHERFTRRQPKAVKVFAPAWAGDDCRLFVEWGYVYPKPNEFRRLYLSDGTDTTQSHRHLVLCTAGAATTQARPGEIAQVDTWFFPRWHLVGDSVFHTQEELVHASFDHRPEIISLREESPLTTVPLAVGIGKVSDAVGARSDLERRIGLHERELELLHSKIELLDNVQRGEDFLAIYLWKQPLGQGSRLPPSLEEFLKKPIAELGRYCYGRVETKGELHHYVSALGTQPASRVLAVPCDAHFLCDGRWPKWGLPLYVRADCSLNCNIDDHEIAQKFWELLERENVPRDCQFVLVEPQTEANGRVAGLRFSTLTVSTPLDQSLQLTNALAAGPAAVARLAAARADGAVVVHDVKVSPETTALDLTLRERASKLVRQSEAQWEELRQKVQRETLHRRIQDLLLDVTKQSYAETAATWIEQVNAIVATDERIARIKLDELKAWTAGNEDRRQRQEKLEQAQMVVADLIQNAIREFDRIIMPQLKAGNDRVETALKTLQERREACDAEKKKGDESLKAIQPANAELTKANAELERQLQATRKEVAQAEAALTERDRRRDELTAVEGELRERRDRCKIRDRDFAQRLAALEITISRADEFVRAQRPPPPTLAPPRRRSRWRELLGLPPR